MIYLFDIKISLNSIVSNKHSIKIIFIIYQTIFFITIIELFFN